MNTQDRCTAVFDLLPCERPESARVHRPDAKCDEDDCVDGNPCMFAHPFISCAEAPTSEASCTKESGGVDAPLPSVAAAPRDEHFTIDDSAILGKPSSVPGFYTVTLFKDDGRAVKLRLSPDAKNALREVCASDGEIDTSLAKPSRSDAPKPSRGSTK